MQHKIVNMLDPQSHHNPQPKRSSSSGTLNIEGLVQTAEAPVRQQWSYCSLALSHRYDPTMKHSHCEAVYAKELFQWLFFELAHPPPPPPPPPEFFKFSQLTN